MTVCFSKPSAQSLTAATSPSSLVSLLTSTPPSVLGVSLSSEHETLFSSSDLGTCGCWHPPQAFSFSCTNTVLPGLADIFLSGFLAGCFSSASLVVLFRTKGVFGLLPGEGCLRDVFPSRGGDGECLSVL